MGIKLNEKLGKSLLCLVYPFSNLLGRLKQYIDSRRKLWGAPSTLFASTTRTTHGGSLPVLSGGVAALHSAASRRERRRYPHGFTLFSSSLLGGGPSCLVSQHTQARGRRLSCCCRYAEENDVPRCLGGRDEHHSPHRIACIAWEIGARIYSRGRIRGMCGMVGLTKVSGP